MVMGLSKVRIMVRWSGSLRAESKTGVESGVTVTGISALFVV
jgi:hypothetical protein